MGKASTIAVLLLLALSPPLAGARTAAPPGLSEADQYFETLPGSTGPRTPDTERAVEDAVREGRLTAAGARALEGRGAAGLVLADAVAKTAPADAPGGSGGGGAGAVGGEPAAPEERGLRAAFPLLLLAMAAAAAAFVVQRRRRSTLA